MNKHRVILESYLVLFLRQKRLRNVWNTSTKILLYSSLVSLISAVPASSGLLPWWTGILILIVPSFSVSLFFLLWPVDIIKFCADLDEIIFRDQTLIVWYEMILIDDSENLYYNILSERVLNSISQIKPKTVYPIRLNRSVVLTIIFTFFSVLSASYSYLYHSLPDYKLAADHLGEAAKRLAVKEDPDNTFRAAIDKMNKLEEKLEEEKGSSYEIEKAIEDLTEEITKQLSALRRDALSSLIKEKTIDSERGNNFKRLLEDDLSMDESREFVLDFLKDDSVSENQKRYIQKSYEDYSSDPDNPDSTELAEDLIDSFAPKSGEMAEAIERAKESLNKALEKLNSYGEKEIESGDSGDRPGISGQHEGADKGAPDELNQDGNSSAPAGGSEENKSAGGDDFIPSELNGIQAGLPEGEIIIDSDTGILRIEGDEELGLEWIEGIYDDTPFEEGLIRDYKIPSDMRGLVKKYFTLIGEMSAED